MSEMHQHVQKTMLLGCGDLIPPSIIFFRNFCSENIFYSFLLCIDLFLSIHMCQSAASSFPPSGSSSVLGLLKSNDKIESGMGCA